MQPKNVGALLATGGIVIAAWFGPYDKPSDTEKTPQTQEVILSDATKKFAINAEVVTTPTARNQGLMYRESLLKDGGMLFLWSDLPKQEMPAGSGFWMKNTPLPLAIIFAYNNQVVHIERSAEPNNLTLLRPSNPNQAVDAVLEISASHPLAQKIQEGWQLSY